MMCTVKRDRTARAGVLLLAFSTLLYASSTLADKAWTVEAQADNQPLKIYTWLRYVDPELIVEFEKQHDAKVEFSYFDSDESRDRELALNAGRGYDLLMLNRQQLPRYVKQGWLERMSDEDVPNRRNIDTRWTENLGEASEYAIANFWGTMGIGYRQEHFPEGMDSWKQLMQPDERLRKRLAMPNFTRGLVALALKANQLSVNTSDHNQIVAAGKQVLAQQPYVLTYDYTALDETADLVTDKIWAGAYYNGDILLLQQYDENIHFATPREGALLWIDFMAVTQASTNKELAFKFLDFFNQPEIAARQSLYLQLASANSRAREHLPEEFLTNPVIFPSQEILDRSEFLQPLPPRSQKQINSVGSRLFR